MPSRIGTRIAELDQGVDEPRDHPRPEAGDVEGDRDRLGRDRPLGPAHCASSLLCSTRHLDSIAVDLDSYIQAHQPEWGRLEQATAGGSRALGSAPAHEIAETVRLYLRASSHLAEVQTRYHDPGLERYLNGLVSRAHGAIYGGSATSGRSFLRFFVTRYRAVFRRTLPFIAVIAITDGRRDARDRPVGRELA